MRHFGSLARSTLTCTHILAVGAAAGLHFVRIILGYYYYDDHNHNHRVATADEPSRRAR